jgi:uncharacterized Zn finger protein
MMSKSNSAAPSQAAHESRWRQITWDHLEEWAGPRSVQRGRSYQRSKRVKKLASTDDGGLVAWVQGTHRYATQVDIEGKADGEPALASRCTCPVGMQCKHAVAVIVEYLDALQHGREVTKASGSDRRLRLLEREQLDYEPDWDDADSEGGEDWDEETTTYRESRRRRSHSASKGQKLPADMHAYLEGLPANELVAYILRLADEKPDIQRDLRARATLARGEVGELVREARREIRRATAEPGWVNKWTGEGSLPDYSDVQRLFERLLEMGQADVLLELAETLFEAGTEQVGSTDDEGETVSALAECLAVAFRALPATSRTEAQKLLFAIEVALRDEYELCHELDEFLGKTHPKEAWSEVADVLTQRWRDMPKPRGDAFMERYHRDRLTRWLTTALEQAGRDAGILPLLEAEAPITHSYQRLVDALLAAGRTEDARRWAAEGIAQTEKSAPGIASQLRERLRELAERDKNWPVVAAMRAEEFFYYPARHTLDALEKAAERAGCRAEVHAGALHFLETGVRPVPTAPRAAVTRTRRPARPQPKRARSNAPPWPLPAVPPELKQREPEFGPDRPHFDVLLELALHEKRPDDILRWYDRLLAGRQRSPYGMRGTGYDERVADAIAKTHPDRAADLYREHIAECAARTSPSAYEQALPALRKLRALLDREGGRDEWQRYLSSLRETERRKRRFLEVLERVERRPIVNG